MEQFCRKAAWLKEFDVTVSSLLSGMTPLRMTGLSAIHKSHLICYAAIQTQMPALLITPDEMSARRACEDMNTFLGSDAALLYPAREFSFRDVDSMSREYEHARLYALNKLRLGECRILAASVEAVLQYTIPPEKLDALSLTLKPGEEHSMERLAGEFIKAGYKRTDQVEGVCQFSIRGGILDFFAPHNPEPYRLEFWGDEIDSVFFFNIETQRRGEQLTQARITPAREALYDDPEQFTAQLDKSVRGLRGKNKDKSLERINNDLNNIKSNLSIVNLDKYLPLLYRPATLLDYFADGLIFISEEAALKEAYKSARWQLDEDIAALLEEGLLFPGCDRFCADFIDLLRHAEKSRTVLLDSFVRGVSEISIRTAINVSAAQLSSWGGELSVLSEDLSAYIKNGYCCCVFAGTERAASALAADLSRDGFRASYTKDIPELVHGSIFVVEGAISSGFEYPDIKLAVIAHTKVALSQKRKKRKSQRGRILRSISDISPGDYIVHVSHGIGVFEGIIKREIHGVTKDYIRIRYAGTDMLFVPVTQLDLVTKYIGAGEEANIRLNRLNSSEWQKTRSRVKAAVTDMARELTILYAQRMKAQGFAFSEDNDWQRDFELRFPYDETDDQIRCIEEIKADMQSPSPMDRLLCGDVGFGKTEVAIRAAFKCVLDSKQCAVLVPTTILAWQHFQTFKQRMEGFPISIELLSRFVPPPQRKEIVKKLGSGEVDIVIGTHRLVQDDVQFKDLGLLVIDEEQRFGVAHKEKLKALRSSVDVLCLSATPIPRTLNMAMSGIRDMSIIDEAPQDRYPVQTYVLEYDAGVVAETMRRELRRGGQVFYLHNRIDSIQSCAHRIMNMLPDARVAVAHGRMAEEELSRVWRMLIEAEIDILVCTTIIETGVDVPNCNTLIIEDADRMGLSQLYQLRGRVGRSTRRAFAYLTFTRGKAVSDVASKRLSAIREFTSFGSGFRIAMRDLEIRGAGNILGAQQHGNMEAVGYEMYLRLLSDAVSQELGHEPDQIARECQIDIRIEAHIPDAYIGSMSQRIDIYKKIAAIADNSDAMDVVDELIDRFGEPPASVMGLIDVALLRNTAAKLGITEISQKNESIILYPEKLDMQSASLAASRLRGRVLVNAGAKPYIAVKIAEGERAVDTMKLILTKMMDVN